MSSVQKFNPDNPREWEPDHYTLFVIDTPHESAGVLRIMRNGYGGSKVLALFPGMKATSLMNIIRRAIDEEGIANMDGRIIYNGKVT